MLSPPTLTTRILLSFFCFLEGNLEASSPQAVRNSVGRESVFPTIPRPIFRTAWAGCLRFQIAFWKGFSRVLKICFNLTIFTIIVTQIDTFQTSASFRRWYSILILVSNGNYCMMHPILLSDGVSFFSKCYFNHISRSFSVFFLPFSKERNSVI